jgi:chemotaxis signal transduction protein
MSAPASIVTDPPSRAAQMRRDFDAGFTRPAQRSSVILVDVLALRLGDEPRLLRLRDIAGVIAHPVLTSVPTPAPALQGIVGNRGSVVAAYDLGTLLGQPPAIPRWLVITAAEPSVAVTFEQFDGYQRIERDTADPAMIVEMPMIIDTIRDLAREARHDLPNDPQFRPGD